MALKIYSNGNGQVTFENTVTGKASSLPSAFLGYVKNGDSFEFRDYRSLQNYSDLIDYTNIVDAGGNSFASADAVMDYVDGFFGEYNVYLAYLFQSGYTDAGIEAIDTQGTQSATRERITSNALDFNGVDQYIDCGTDVGSYTDNFFIGCWVYRNSDTLGVVFSKRSGRSDYQIFIRDTSGRISLFEGITSNDALNFTIPLNTWTYIYFLVSNGEVFLGVNDQKESLGNYTLQDNGYKFLIGAAIESAPTAHFDGKISKLQIYNTALSDADITKLYNHEQITTKPVNEYLFEENADSIAIDSGTAENNGTIANYADSMRVLADFTVMPSVGDIKGYTLSDGSTYYLNDDDTGLIASGVKIPALASGGGVAAYLAGGTRASLEFTGKLPNNFSVINANYLQGNGVDQAITIGNTSINVTSIEFWVKQSVDNQVIFTLQNSTATAVSVVAGVLTFGASLTASNIEVDGESATASEAGALLNNNEWHKVSFDLTSIAASNLVLFTDGTSFGNIGLSQFKLNDTDFILPLSNGALSSVIAKVGSSYEVYSITNFTSSMWQQDATGTLPSWNTLNGHTLYEHASLANIYVPKIGDSFYDAFSVPTGYSKTADYEANNGYNGSEVSYNPPLDYFLHRADITNFLYTTGDLAQEIGYAEFNTEGGDVNDESKITYNINGRNVTNLKIRE